MGPVMSGSQLVSHEVESPTSGLAQVGVVQVYTHDLVFCAALVTAQDVGRRTITGARVNEDHLIQ